MRMFARSDTHTQPEVPALSNAVADYLALSRSPLRWSAPDWFAAVEPVAWDALMRAACTDSSEADRRE